MVELLEDAIEHDPSMALPRYKDGDLERDQSDFKRIEDDLLAGRPPDLSVLFDDPAEFAKAMRLLKRPDKAPAKALPAPSEPAPDPAPKAEPPRPRGDETEDVHDRYE